MISILHEKDYEMVGNTEVRLEDWQRTRVEGAFRFVVRTASQSFQAKVAFWLMIATLPEVPVWRTYWKENTVLLIFACYCFTVALIHAFRIWARCERRFNRT
jgi:hypothetical protein